MGTTVAVAGASGYAGGELLRLLAGHPELDVGPLTAHASAGERLGDVHPQLVSLADRVLAPTTPESLADADLVFLALPHGESAALAAQLPAEPAGRRPRRRPPAAPTPRPGRGYYGGAHAGSLDLRPARAARPARRDRGAPPGRRHRLLRGRDHPGARPAVAAGLVEPDDVVVVAASGTSGAGRAGQGAPARQRGDGRPLALQGRRVTSTSRRSSRPPARRTLSLHAGAGADAARHPGHRHARPARPAVDAGAVRSVLAAAYGDEPFVHLLPEGRWPHTAATLGPNSRPPAGHRRRRLRPGDRRAARSTTWARAPPARPCSAPTSCSACRRPPA